MHVEDVDLMGWRGVPGKYREISWQSLDLDLYPEGLRRKVEWLQQWSRDSREWAVVLHGPRGSGKTAMAAATMHRARFSPRAKWLDWPTHLMVLSDSWSTPVSEAEVIHEAQNATMLVVDDFGLEADAGPVKDWQMRAAFQLISHRYNYRKPTVITTQLTPAVLAERISDAVASRLHEDSRWINLSEMGDLRTSKKRSER